MGSQTNPQRRSLRVGGVVHHWRARKLPFFPDSNEYSFLALFQPGGLDGEVTLFRDADCCDIERGQRQSAGQGRLPQAQRQPGDLS
jgi:hypothetical protein